MKLGLTWAGAILLVAGSYLTLLVFASSKAEHLAGGYAIVVFVLAAGNLWSEHHAK